MTTPAVLVRSVPGRPGAGRLLGDQVRHALRELWRSRVVFVFTFLFPLTWLVVIGFLAGNETVDEASGVRLMQFTTPTAGVMGVLFAAFPTVATTLAAARERGVLKRVRGTPLPARTYLAARIAGAVVFAVGSLVTMVVIGVVVYDVQVVWRTALAATVTVVLAIACFAALGLAVAALAPSAGVAEAGSIGTAVVLAFASGVYTVGELPAWLTRIASVLPLQPFHEALRRQFDPFAEGAGWDLRALAVLAAWGLLAATVATWGLRRREGGRAHGRSAPVGRPAAEPPTHPVGVGGVAVTAPGRPTALRMLRAQARWALAAAARDPGWVFFSIAVPVGLYAFVMATNDPLASLSGTPLGLYLVGGMAAWGAAVTAFMNTPEAMARARERGILKRLRGTPLTPAAYLAGRGVAALVLALVTGALVLAVAVLAFDVQVGWTGVPLAAAVLALGVATLGACGVVLVAALPSSTAMTAVGLAVLLPVSFFSDVFPVGGAPSWMGTVGAFLPLKHVANSLTLALDPAGPWVSWTSVAVLAAWLTGATLLALRTFRWEPSTGDEPA